MTSNPVLTLFAHPGRTYTFAWLRAQPAPAIALDGCVEGPTVLDLTVPCLSLNHHEGPDRMATRATCEQAALSVEGGLWRRLHREGRPAADVHVNDADPDVCTSVWTLRNPDRLAEPAVARLVAVEGLLDANGATWCPARVDGMLGELAWVFAPCHLVRESGRALDAEAMIAMIEEVEERITAHVEGRGGRLEAWGDFEVVARRGDMAAVVEHGPYPRMGLHRAGIETVVAERRSGDVRVVTLAKTSPFAGSDLVAAYERLNQLEGCPEEDHWGGSDLVGGSPRGRGTFLPLDVILDVLAIR